ncbi:MAG: serine hydrolase [Sediminibacterium sp. Gen4]|jgi:beta-lactamase class A|uniref:serine hydrolase n=1 Tax=unclassified Sediminibacterium TaxID=2635961 RepID=UPI0015C1779A|nr:MULTISPECIES: serine hydrolase [unclassified Sediminibacterium]MBW0162645.1 class A beta-lactamase-related serine hydrolase [Sediminibacterium sp.]MBW0164940.1 class A beta-lactamase-related serine hydrolase [Sediminibacterium sp.]NWK64395.1 serine hydrolase [Sediminibacterium sp. Gen4]
MQRIFLLCLLIGCIQLNAQKTDKKLQHQIETLLQGFRGDIGVYVHDLKKNRVAAVHADTIFPTASMVKVPIMIGVMDKISKKELDYHQSLTYKDSLLYEGVDILGSFKNNEKIDLSKVMMLMLTTSDNTASLWLQSLAGTGTRINQLMDSLGFPNTKVNSRTPGREEIRKIYGWGQTTPREMATLFEKIAARQILSDSASDKMLKLLGRNYWDEEGLSVIPAGVFVASKNGAVNASRSEVIYIQGEGVNYVFCICTKNNQDQTWTPTNEAWTLTRKLSSLLWEYYKR